MARTIAQPGPDRTNRLLFMGAVALALIAAIAVFATLSGVGSGNGSSPSGDRDVLVASRDIAPGTTISEEMLELASFSEATLVDGTVTDEGTLVGKKIAYPMLAGQQFSEKFIAGDVNCPTLDCKIGSGMQLAPVTVDLNRVFGGLLAPGVRVDARAVLETPGDSGERTLRAVMIVQNARVVSVGDSAQDTGSATPKDEDANPRARTLSVEVPPDEAARIALAQEQGEIYLFVRAIGDDSIDPDPEDVTLP